MAEGQIRKDLIKKARKTPAKPAETTKVEESDDPNSQASIDAGSLEGKVSPAPTIREEREGLSPDKADIALDAAFAQMDSQDKAQEQVLADRRGIASGLKDLSKRGALTGDLLKEARQRATAAGVSEEQFSSFMGKEDIKTQNFATAAPTESKEEAAQNVVFQRQYGTGLGTLAAMQDPNYELGSGSALRQPARSIGPASGKFRRAARRLRRQGYGAAAQAMAMRGEMARVNEPSIDTPALRGQRMLQKMAAGKEAGKQDKIMAGATGDKSKSGAIKKAGSGFDKREKERDSDSESRKKARDKMINPMQTQEFRDANGNGIEDRSEGIYRESDYIVKPKNWGKNKAL